MLFFGNGPALGAMGEWIDGLPKDPGLGDPIGGSATNRHNYTIRCLWKYAEKYNGKVRIDSLGY